ncbi:hypothetical protein FOZ60_015466 [Perkinsus olseni]|uniref:Uncharacterized protein n=1 Tax=Perkinsus olseni TaxID=32597 RepID=A0A7J6P5U1_PEROL|nr:hypothetical protein FOZ60_015466 [Perkinsus olseni]
MTFFVVRILLIIGLTVAALDGNVEPKDKKEFRFATVQDGAATGHYQFDDNLVVNALRGSEDHLIPGPVEKVSSDSPKLQDNCGLCKFCSDIGYVTIACWPTLAECGIDCRYCC